MQWRTLPLTRRPDFHAGICAFDEQFHTGGNFGHWMASWSWFPCRDQCCGPGQRAGSVAPYVIPTSVRDPLRDHGRRAGPGISCWMQCGVREHVRDPDFSAGPTRYPVMGLPPNRLSSSPRELLPSDPSVKARRCVGTALSTLFKSSRTFLGRSASLDLGSMSPRAPG